MGIRPGEKIHEQMIDEEDAPLHLNMKTYYKILPNLHGWSEDKNRIGNGKKVSNDFVYESYSNKDYMSVDYLEKWIKKIARFKNNAKNFNNRWIRTF